MIYLKIFYANGSFRRLLFLTQFKRSPPAQSSITMIMCFQVSIVSQILTTWLCLSFKSSLTSLNSLFFYYSSVKTSLLRDLRATSFRTSLCMARLTFPNAPLPSILPTLQKVISVSGGLIVVQKAVATFFITEPISCDLGLNLQNSLSTMIACLVFNIFP